MSTSPSTFYSTVLVLIKVNIDHTAICINSSCPLPSGASIWIIFLMMFVIVFKVICCLSCIFIFVGLFQFFTLVYDTK